MKNVALEIPAHLVKRRLAGAGVRPLPRMWECAVIAMVAVFYDANVYDYVLAGKLFYVKWLMVAPVIALSWRAAQRRVTTAMPPSPLPLVLLGFAALLSVLASQRFGESAVIFVSLLLALVTAYALAYAIMRTGGERQFFDAVALVGRLVIVSAAVFWPLGLSLGRGSSARFTAWADNPNTLALLLAPTLVILMGDVLSRRRGWLWWSLPFLASGAFLLMTTGSRASMLWVLAAGLGFYTFWRGIGFSLVLGLGVLILGFEFSNEIMSLVLGLVRRDGVAATVDVLSGRSEIWPLGLHLFGEQPLVGHGLGTSQSMLTGYEWLFIEAQGQHFHNSYLTVAVETGAAGVVALGISLLAAIAGGARRSRQAKRQRLVYWPASALPWAVMVGALAHAFFETWLLSAGNANMIILWTCILLLQGRACGTDRAAPSNLRSPAARGAMGRAEQRYRTSFSSSSEA